MNWTPKEVAFLIEQRAANVSSVAVARELKRTRQSVENKLKQLIANGSIEAIPKAKQTKVVDFTTHESRDLPEFDKFYKIKGDIIVISDVHVPFHHVKLLDYVVRIARKFGIKTLHIAGDFINADAFSHHIGGFKGEKNSELEFKAAEVVLTEFLKVFDRIYITTGNHEDRIYKTLAGQVPHSRFFKMLHAEVGKRIKVSDYPYLELNDDWIIGHPSNYGSRGGQVPTDIADKMEKNVILGHNHMFGIQMSRSGKYMGIDHGASIDPLKSEYYSKGVNTFRTWQNGFTMIMNNYPYVFNLNKTDWNWWLK